LVVPSGKMMMHSLHCSFATRNTRQLERFSGSVAEDSSLVGLHLKGEQDNALPSDAGWLDTRTIRR
jgi:hypothetical protein